MLVFVCSGVLGLFVPQLLGGGHTMVTLLLQEHPTIKILILLLLGKFLFSLLSFASGAPGGIFFPLLILGTYLAPSMPRRPLPGLGWRRSCGRSWWWCLWPGSLPPLCVRP